MTIKKTLFKIPEITEEEMGYPIRQKVGRPHRIHRSKKNSFDFKKKLEKSIKYKRAKGII